MTGFSRSPRVQKGAILGLDKFNPLASVVVFQYNPETLSRTLTAQTSTADGAQGDALRLKAPPKEDITGVKIELDAADQLEQSDGLAAATGLYPALASLEMLLYPKSVAVIRNEVLKAAGAVEVMAPEAPLTLFYWGLKRVLPVRITSLTIQEKQFDPDLNPILADVTLTMRVLSHHDLGLLSPGGALYMAHQILKEGMATMHGAGQVAGSISGSISF
ncbi:hypothetical protein [Rubrivirga sp.]|uniref:hypothetical protein n=1 Tax=Rubrivirga sp. TaxID=1885344 RepID=UPI003B519162